MTKQDLQTEKKKRRFGCLHVLGIFLIVIIITTFLTGWWIKRNIYASPFTPTQLNEKEEQVLESKLSRLEESAAQGISRPSEQSPNVVPEKLDDPDAPLQPEPYSEENAKREINLSEKELNALIAKEPELAQRMVIDFSDDLISLAVLVPVDEEFPILGGKTIRIKAGVAVSHEKNKLFIALRGISIGGIPIPNAWLGDIKNRNLVEEFCDQGGFWDLFSQGVDNIQVREGHLWLKLKE